MPTHGFDACMMTAEACRRELGERVRESLAAAGWRQADLAAAAGLQKSVVSRVAAGRRIPREDTLRAICAALGRSEDDLLPGIAARREGGGRARSADVVRTTATRPGRVLVEVRREVDARTALEIQRLAEEGAAG